MAIPTGDAILARDGWANGETAGGFERELLAILDAARRARVANLVWITTDVHHATAFRHRPFAGFHVHELVTGPLHAGIFRSVDLDPTLRPERLAFHAPPSGAMASSSAESRAWWSSRSGRWGR